MINISVRADVRQAQRFLTQLRKDGVKAAAARAINDTLITLRAEGARMIKSDHPALKIGDIKANIRMKRAFKYNLRGSVSTSGRPQTLLLFAVRGGEGHRRSKGVRGQVLIVRTLKPITAQIGRNRSVMQLQGRKAFRVLAYGNEIFVRRHATGRQIRRLRGPSLPGVFRAKGNPMQDLAQQRWKQAFASRLKYEIALARSMVGVGIPGRR